jgi:hypothetical protein
MNCFESEWSVGRQSSRSVHAALEGLMYISGLQPAGRMRPAESFYVARNF